jgi:hypothetical protein
VGRKAGTFTSYPTDPTPTSKWVASSQGELVDTNGGKMEIDSIRGRGAVQETFGLRRARLYEVRMEAYIDGKWTTVLTNAAKPDVISDATRAYAVGYTPVGKLCWSDHAFKRTYRVLNIYGVRRSDNIVANRTLYSSNFVAPGLLSDPGCKSTVLQSSGSGPDEMNVGDTIERTFTVTNPTSWEGMANDAIPDVKMHIGVSDGLKATEIVPAGSSPKCVAAPPNNPDQDDWICTFGPLNPGSSVSVKMNVEALAPGEFQWWNVTPSSSATWVAMDGWGHGNINVSDPNAEGTDLINEIRFLNEEGYNVDRDPAKEGLQLYSGDKVTYQYLVANGDRSGGTATGVYIAGFWPDELGDITKIGDWEQPTCDVTPELDELFCDVGEVISDDVKSAYLQTEVTAPPGTTVEVTSQAWADQDDINHSNNDGRLTFEVIDTP